MECSITHLGECVVEYLFSFIIDLINQALQPFLDVIHKLMIEQVNISIFSDVWGIIVYILSMFYGILLIYIGIQFIISGESPEKREKAKSSLKDTIIMMILIQVSYYLYSLIISISSALTKTILNIAGNDFFELSSESFSNIAMELSFLGLYVIHLIVASLILMLRYMAVSIGVVFFAIGIFFYFIDPLKSYGKLIINGLMTLIFLPFFYSIIFLACSKLLELDSLSDLKILIMIGAFSFIIVSTLIALFFVIVKAALKISGPALKVAAVATTAATVIG